MFRLLKERAAQAKPGESEQEPPTTTSSSSEDETDDYLDITSMHPSVVGVFLWLATLHSLDF